MIRRLPAVAILFALAAVALGACGVSEGDAASPGSGVTTTDGSGTGDPDDDRGPSADEARYQIDVGSDWEESPSSMAIGVTTWYVGDEASNLGANVNVLVQETGDATLEEYMEQSLVGIERFLDDSEVIDQTITEGSEGQEIGLLEYAGSLEGEDLHFLAVATPVPDGMALATFTATDAEFSDLRDSVETQLRTLRPA